MCGYLWVCFGMYGYVLEFNVSKRLSFGAWFIEALTPQLVYISLRIHEDKLGFKVVKKMVTIIHQQKSLQSLTTFNSKIAGLTSSAEFRLRSKPVVQQHLLFINIKNPLWINILTDKLLKLFT